MFDIKEDYYDDVGILYSFDSPLGDSGYCVKEWSKTFNPNKDKPSFSGLPNARWIYYTDNFQIHEAYLMKRRKLKDEVNISDNYHMFKVNLNIVTDENVLAKYALLYNKLSSKTNIMVTLEKLKNEINTRDYSSSELDELNKTLKELM